MGPFRKEDMSKAKQTNIPKEAPKKAKPVVKADPNPEPKKEKAQEPAEAPKLMLSKRELQIINALRDGDVEASAFEREQTLKEIQEKQRKAKELAKQREWDNVIVEGVFTNHENRGAAAEFTFYKYEGDPVRKYKLKDGHKYRIPRMVAIHLNEGCKYRVHAHATDKEGNPVENIGEPVERYSFYSTQFVDVSDPKAASLFPSKGLTTVSYG